MKRIITSLVILLAVFVLSAATPVTFSGRYALVGSDSRTIRRTTVDIAGTGVIMATGEDEAGAETSEFRLVTAPGSMVAIKDEDGLVIYLVYGSVNVIKTGKEEIRVYTPVTLVTLSSPGEYRFVSSDEEESVSNYSRSSISGYDSVRGRYVTVAENECYDYIKGRVVGADMEAMTLERPLVPAKPIFKDEALRVLSGTPDKPVFVNVDRSVTGEDEKVEEAEPQAPSVPAAPSVPEVPAAPAAPAAPSVSSEIVAVPEKVESITVTQTLVAEPEKVREITVTQTLVAIPDKVSSITVTQTLVDSEDN